MTTTEPTPEALRLAGLINENIAGLPAEPYIRAAEAILADGYAKPQPFEPGDRLFDRSSMGPSEEEITYARDQLLRIFARQNQPTGELRETVLAGTEQLSGALVDAIIESEWENAYLLALREHLATLLTRTANALKGDPPALTSWSWHDLPAVATELRKQVQG